MKNLLRYFLYLLLFLFLLGGSVYMVVLAPFLKSMNQTTLVQVDSNFTLMLGGGGNSGIFESSDQVVLIDTKMDQPAAQLHQLVQTKLQNKRLTVINTHWHPDHVGGNKLYKGSAIVAGNYGKEAWIKENKEEGLPDLWLKDTMTIHLDNDTLVVFNFHRRAHTSNDVMVYSKQRQLLFTGDLVQNKQCPVLLGDANANEYLNIIDWLSANLKIRTVVPGHGFPGGPILLEEFETYLLDMREAAHHPEKEKDLVAKYKTWRQLPFLMSPGASVKHFKNLKSE
jgi:glyoxylase-like metal-dependent hydrolase (beta-lactamase superfamily II)